MELLIGLFALFWFCFFCLVVFNAMRWGTALSDRLLVVTGQTLKWALQHCVKGLVLLIRYAFSRVKKPEHMAIRPIIATPLELEHMRRQQLIQSNSRVPVEIEYTPPKRK
jgi:hypothetical protein